MKPRAAMFRTHARGSSFGVERMQNPHKAKEETYGYMRAGSMSVRVPKHKEKIKAPLLWCFLVILQVHTAAAVYCLLGDIRKDFVRHSD